MFGWFSKKEELSSKPLVCSMCKLYRPIQTKDMGDEFCFLCVVKRAREALGLDQYNQPIKSEPIKSIEPTTECKNCNGIPRIFNCCGYKHLNDIQCDDYRFRMHCSKNCKAKQNP